MKADVIILGGGVAGLAAALQLAPTHRVVLVSKARLGQGGSTAWAQGGVAAALGRSDSAELHCQDTLKVGCGLNHEEAVAVLTREGPARLLELVEQGARFDRAEDGSLALGQEAAHSRRRIVHAADATGAEILRAMSEALTTTSVQVVEEAFAVDLLTHRDRVTGVIVQLASGARAVFTAPAVVLATGGSGQVYAHTTNPVECTGDGLAMAFRAGARLRDLEFVQFHPTALDAGDPMPLLTEALRGEGARLIDENGHRFMLEVHSDAELAPRDVVARGIWRHRAAGHQTLLDATHLGERFPVRFPTVFALCSARGLDPRAQAIPVSPAAHYHMGGVEADLNGRTSLPGLWACGEVTATGVHGANRLASNSLLEGLVFGARVAQDIAASPAPRAHQSAVVAPAQEWRWRQSDPMLINAVRDLMWREVGLVRAQAGLQRALGQLERLRPRLASSQGEAANLLEVATLVATAALARPESRGAHYRSDHPDTREEWRAHLVLEQGPLTGAPLSLGKVS